MNSSPSRRLAVLSGLLLAGTALPAMAQTTTDPQNPPAAAQSTTPPGVGGTPQTQTAEPATTENAIAENQTEVVVTGYRQSLASSTNAKKNSTGFTDSIFAEDIGKFPDTNITETFNRIPGITIVRDVTGEGINVAIRGLGVNFTKVLLNNAPVAVASTGRTDSANANREVDLDLFPIELFTQLTVSKTPQADMVEGGVAGTVNMRSARPFDNPGNHLTYNAQGVENTVAGKLGGRGSLILSHTSDTFGILVGAAGFRNEVRTKGFETIGYTNPSLTAAQCGTGYAGCNSAYGGNGFAIPSTVPANAGNGLTTGQTIDNAFLLARNPGATIQQIDNGLIPRLGRPSDEYGKKDRYNFIASAEYRPSENLHFYVDGMYGRKHNDLQRIDMDWVGRNGATIPLNTTYDKADCSTGCTVTKGTYANSQFFLEYRPYIEDTKFWGVNPGGEWTIARNLKVNLQGNYTRSTFQRQSPTVLVNTPASSGVTVNYDNTAGTIPSITSNIDLNNPANFVWTGGRVNLQAERRITMTKGARGDVSWGDEHLALKVGGSYDDISRSIAAVDNSQAWQNAVCGNNPSVSLPSPNTQPPCQGLSIPGSAAAVNAINPAYPSYPGYGSGFTAGAVPGSISYAGSLIPQTQLASFLRPGPSGFVTVDFNSFRRASNYDAFFASAPQVGSANTGASGGYIREKTPAAFAEVNGNLPIGDNRLQFNAGIRYVHTDQTISGLVSLPDPRNTPAAPAVAPLDGARYPNVTNGVTTYSSYDNWLPSVSAAFHIGDSTVVRGSVSRTLTRPDPSAELPGVNFSSPSADTGSIGNPNLKPYLSTNFDVGFEYYTGREGYFGVAAFRKSITGFTNTGLTTLPFSALGQYGITYDSLTPTQQAAINARGGPTAATVSISQQVNAEGVLRVNGLEFNWVQPLDFVLERYLGVRGFGFTANVTLVDQKGSGAAPQIAFGVSPVTYNVTAYYEGHGLTVRASTVFNAGSQTAGVNQNGIPTAALFSNDYQQYDLSSSLDLNKVFGTTHMPQVTFDVLNITNAEQRSYFQFNNAAFTSYKPGTTFLFGLRGRF